MYKYNLKRSVNSSHYWAPANRTRIVSAFDPPFDTFCVVVVPRITYKRSNFVITFVLLHAYYTLVVMLKLVGIKL